MIVTEEEEEEEDAATAASDDDDGNEAAADAAAITSGDDEEEEDACACVNDSATVTCEVVAGITPVLVTTRTPSDIGFDPSTCTPCNSPGPSPCSPAGDAPDTTPDTSSCSR